ncbi:kinase-like domain-containing protein [Entophlyctis helioformis]|nr:kinase-like domain-containing protein [Entophlyctis helioformis]
MACIEDTSSNGTVVNGKTINKKRIPLPHASEIEIKFDIHFVFLNYIEAGPTALLPTVGNKYYVFESQVLGQGSFATVKMAIDISNLDRVACKIIDTRRLQLNQRGGPTSADFTAALAAIEQEVAVLQRVGHPNIVSIKDVVQCDADHNVCIFLSRISGGELFDHIVKNGRIPEAEAKFIFYQLLLAVNYLHEHNICHRDLKAENVLLESPRPFSRLLISDFGMAKSLENSVQQMQTKCGTFTYLAPEIIDSPGGYSKQVDCWALALAGALPFGSDHDQPRLVRRIRKAEYSFDDAAWAGVSATGKSMVASLLQVDPGRRLTVAQALQHPWIAERQDVLARLYGKMLDRSGIRINGSQIKPTDPDAFRLEQQDESESDMQ